MLRGPVPTQHGARLVTRGLDAKSDASASTGAPGGKGSASIGCLSHPRRERLERRRRALTASMLARLRRGPWQAGRQVAKQPAGSQTKRVSQPAARVSAPDPQTGQAQPPTWSPRIVGMGRNVERVARPLIRVVWRTGRAVLRGDRCGVLVRRGAGEKRSRQPPADSRKAQHQTARAPLRPVRKQRLSLPGAQQQARAGVRRLVSCPRTASRCGLTGQSAGRLDDPPRAAAGFG